MDYSSLGSLLPRYFRFVGDAESDCVEYMAEGVIAKKVPWAPQFFCIPGCLSLRGSCTPDYKQCGLYPMDIASSLPIMLLTLPADRKIKVLDLCCCPGSKFQMISDHCNSDSLVVGVDISKQRLDVCMSLLRSWNEQQLATKKKCRQLLFHCDGTSFGESIIGKLIYDSDLINEDVEMCGKVRKRNKSYRDRESKRLKVLEASLLAPPVDGLESEKVSINDFDYVLVDAECTHDASYKHMKFISLPTEDPTSSASTSQTLSKPTAELSHVRVAVEQASEQSGAEQLRDLQRGLLHNGFANLKVGGELVYSTCSKERAQNEDIVQWLLDSMPNAELVNAVETLRSVLPGGVSVRTACETSETGSDTAVGTKISDHNTAAVARAAATHADADNAVAGGARPVPPGTLTAEQVLQVDLPQLFAYLRTHCSTDNTYSTESNSNQSSSNSTSTSNSSSTSTAMRALSFSVWEWAASQTRPVVFESAALPGTVRLSYQGAMSGHFIAKIRKTA